MVLFLRYGIMALLYVLECFSGKYTTCKIHMKVHLGPEWHTFRILTNEGIDDAISCFFTVVFANGVK